MEGDVEENEEGEKKQKTEVKGKGKCRSVLVREKWGKRHARR